MMIEDLLSSGAVPALEMTLRFAGQRQGLINHNIANMSTPNFRPVDADPGSFQKSLDRAIRERRERTGGMHGGLRWDGGGEVALDERGGMRLTPRTFSTNILAHDRNNTDEIRLMQANAENAAVYRIASELLRGRYQQLKDAIAERV